jgi:hypothetical protein
MFVVNHSERFVDQELRFVHTNNIERMWRSIKEQVRGVRLENLDEHLKYFMFERKYLTGNFIYDLVFMKILLN